MSDLVQEFCEALVPVGPGQFGTQCPVLCGKPAWDLIHGLWFCFYHMVQMNENMGGVWTYSQCDVCGQQHGHSGRGDNSGWPRFDYTQSS
jgi:hypothetical protein